MYLLGDAARLFLLNTVEQLTLDGRFHRGGQMRPYGLTIARNNLKNR